MGELVYSAVAKILRNQTPVERQPHEPVRGPCGVGIARGAMTHRCTSNKRFVCFYIQVTFFTFLTFFSFFHVFHLKKRCQMQTKYKYVTFNEKYS